jgi:hypothetical protein
MISTGHIKISILPPVVFNSTTITCCADSLQIHRALQGSRARWELKAVQFDVTTLGLWICAAFVGVGENPSARETTEENSKNAESQKCLFIFASDKLIIACGVISLKAGAKL